MPQSASTARPRSLASPGGKTMTRIGATRHKWQPLLRLDPNLSVRRFRRPIREHRGERRRVPHRAPSVYPVALRRARTNPIRPRGDRRHLARRTAECSRLERARRSLSVALPRRGMPKNPLRARPPRARYGLSEPHRGPFAHRKQFARARTPGAELRSSTYST